MKNKKGFLEKIFYNNKFLFVFSLLLSICLWAVVKINYSDNSTRTLTDVKVSIDSSLAEENDYVAFVEESDLYVDVEVSGKSYNINSYSLSKSDITIEAVAGYVDNVGYKVLNLTAKSVSGGDVTVTSISPSTITVFYDRKATQTFNVEAKLKNELTSLTKGDYVVGQPVASMSTVEVTGPSSVVAQISKVYFEAEIAKDDLPLKATKEVSAKLSYALNKERGSQYLVCNGVDEANPATVTVPISLKKTVPTAVKFINEPTYFEENPPSVSIYPSKVDILVNTSKDGEEETIDKLYVGTVDFNELSNERTKFEFSVQGKDFTNLVNKNIEKFTVRVNMSSFEKKHFDTIPDKVVLLNQVDGYKYDVYLENTGLDNITVIGTQKNIDLITVDSLQIELNVSSLDLNSSKRQKVDVSNISILQEDINDCWVYGNYYAYVTVSKK